MKYSHLSVEEVLSKVNDRYTQSEQEECAFNDVIAIMDYDTEGMKEIQADKTFSPMNFLAEYYHKDEWKDWLINTFLSDEDEVFVDCACGEVRCTQRFDTEQGDIIDVHNVAMDKWLGYLFGRLDDLTEDELVDRIDYELETI